MDSEDHMESGYVIDVKTLFSSFPAELAILEGYYPPGPFVDMADYQCAWYIPSDHLFLDISDFIHERIGEEVDIEIVGDWLGDFHEDCPFEHGEAYVVFDTNQDFAKIVRFLRTNKIPEDKLLFYEWTCRGSDCS